MYAERNLRLRLSQYLALALMMLITTPSLAQELTVLAAEGDAKVRFNSLWQTPQPGMVVDLPVVVSTGANGSLRLQQGETLIAVAANSAIELLANPDGSDLLQRVVQDRGSAFYDIAPQGKNRFRVEAPYLVAVVKGTQFNVTSSAELSTVALFEGLLRIDGIATIRG